MKTSFKYYISKQFNLYSSPILNQEMIGGKKQKQKWDTLIHNGVLFPPEYIPHKKPLKCLDKYVELTPLAEEYIMLYVKYYESEYAKNKTFNNNFFKDWKKVIKDTDIKNLADCDLSEFHKIYQDNKQCKVKSEENIDKYKIAVVNGKEESVGNFRVEPPSIFIGRGDNPNLGKIKRRIYPEDITINISKDMDLPVPKELEGHKWKEIVHNKNVEWIASWDDTITNKLKYVWLGNSSDFKANSDFEKFEIARKLKKKIKQIEEKNNENLKSDDERTKQLATTLWFIDKLAIRVGNEKSDNEADTVGVSTLRVEHVKLYDNKLELNFLGKDSIPYHNIVEIDSDIKNNLNGFIGNKEAGDQIFDLIDSQDINKYLGTFLKGLTAKVFRSYNASSLFQKEIKKITNKYCGVDDADVKVIIAEYNNANVKVAKLLNHQKNVSKSHGDQVKKISDQIKSQRSKLRKSKNKKKIKDKIKQLKTKKELKEDMKNVALGTSKDNYIDPRITVAFLKKLKIPMDKVFSQKLQDKFKWAFDVDENFTF